LALSQGAEASSGEALFSGQHQAGAERLRASPNSQSLLVPGGCCGRLDVRLLRTAGRLSGHNCQARAEDSLSGAGCFG
jgi:hypothetical protein